MVLHGLEGSIEAHSGGEPTSSAHSTFPFAPRDQQPPLASILRNVKYCVESFLRRQEDEARQEFHLKVRHKGERLETIRTLTDRVCRMLEGCDVIDG